MKVKSRKLLTNQNRAHKFSHFLNLKSNRPGELWQLTGSSRGRDVSHIKAESKPQPLGFDFGNASKKSYIFSRLI